MESWLKVVLILSVLVIASSFSPLIYRILNEYEESCIEYIYQDINKSEFYCDGNIFNLNMCYFCYDRWTGEFKADCELGDVDCHCPEYNRRWRNVTLSVRTDNCTTYHLIRKV